ncbi:MAG: tape measure protein [Moraxella sp.]|nr:tape measure protein [Moraxella sp.]
MEQTSRLSIVIDTTNAQSAINNLKNNLKGLQDEAQRTVTALSRLQSNNLSGLAKISTAVGQLNQNIHQTQNAFNQTNNVLNRTSNIFNQVNNTVNRTNGIFAQVNHTVNLTTNNFTRMGDTINRNVTIINNYNNAVGATHNALSRLQGLLTGGMFGVMGLSVLKTADTMQSLDSQIKLVTKSEEEYLTVRQKVRDIADQNYADIEATTNLYQNSARALANLGKTQQEALVFTNAVSLAMRTGGKSALEQKSALYQLGQAMQSGVLNGDEFRSISENAPILLDLVAKKLNVTRGEVKELASEGKITSQVIYETLANATPMLEEMAKKMPITMGQAFALVRNKYKEFIGDFMNNDTGLSGVIAKSLAISSLHFNTFAKVAVAGAGVAMLGFTNRILISGKAMTTLATIMKAHPIFAMASVVMAVSTANRGLEATLDDLGKSLSMVGLMIKDTVNLFSELGSTAYQIFRDITSNVQDTTQTSSQLFGGFFSDTGSGFTGLMHGTAKTFDAMATTVKTFGKLAGENIAYFVTNTWDLFKIMANNIAFVFENIVNSVVGKSVNFIIEKINSILRFSSKAWEFFGNEPIAPLEPYQSNFKIGRFNVGHITQTRTWSELFDETAKEQIDNGALSWTQSLENRANATIPNANLNNPMGEYQKPKDKDKDKKDKKQPEGYLKPSEKKAWDKVYANALKYDFAGYEKKYNLPSGILAGVHMKESLGNPNVTSPKGAMGGFQFMPATWRQWGKGSAYNMANATEAAAKYLSWLIKENKGNIDLALASYNAGIGNVKKYGGMPPFKETKNYVPAVNRYRAYYNGGSNPKTTQSDYANQQSNLNEQAKKSHDDLVSQLLKTPLERLNDELKLQINAIHANTIATADEKQRMIDRAKQIHNGKSGVMKAEAMLQHQSHLLTDEDKAQYEYFRDLGNFYASPNMDINSLEAYQQHLEKVRDTKIEIAKIEQEERELETNRHKMTESQILEKELELDLRRKTASGEYTFEQIQSLAGYYNEQIRLQQKVDEHKQKSLMFEAKQYSMTVFQKIEAERELAHLQLETSEKMSIEELAWHKESIDAKYDYEVKKAKEARNQIFTQAQHDYKKQLYLLQNKGNPYAGVVYDLQNDKENKYTQEEIDTHLDVLKKIEQLDKYKQAQERYATTKFNPSQYNNYFGALTGTAEMAQKVFGDYGLFKDQHKSEQDILKEQFEAREITEAEYYTKREEMAKRHHEAMTMFTLNGSSGILTAMAQMAKYAIGEQSNTYKRLYQMGKAFALAQAGIAVYKAGSDAWANESGTVWQKAIAAAKAVAMSSQFVQLISSANPQGFATGGYTGNIGTSQIAGVVHGQEYVLNAKATKRIGVDTLNRLNNGDGIGGSQTNNINVHVIVNADGTSNVEANTQLGKHMGDAMASVAMQVLHKETRQGGYLDRLYRK